MYNFGYDSNGDKIEESTVEELARIANETLYTYTTNKQCIDSFDIDANSFKEGYYYTGTAWGANVNYDINVEITTDKFDITDCLNEDFTGCMYDYTVNSSTAYAIVRATLEVHNEIIKVDSLEVSCYECTDRGCDTYNVSDTEKFFDKYDRYHINWKIIECFIEAVREVQVVCSNI